MQKALDEGSLQPDGDNNLESLLNFLSNEVIKRRFEAPAIFILEMYRPFVTLGHSLSLVAAPILLPIFGAKNFSLAIKALEDRSAIEQLIELIEAKSKRDYVRS